MPAENMPQLTSADRDRIIRQISANPHMSKAEIHTAAGITNPRGQRREDIILKPWIEENTPFVFRGKIDWQSLNLTNMQGNHVTPDFEGIDSQGDPVIVEVKFKFKFQGDAEYLRSSHEYESIGQILQYACAYMRDNPSTQILRLFIVSIDFSEDVEYVCKILRSKGIDLQHIAIENILCEKEVSA